MKTKFCILVLLALLLSFGRVEAQLNTMLDSTAAQLADMEDLLSNRSNIASATRLNKAYFDAKIGQYFVDVIASLQKYGLQAGNYATLSAAVTAASADTASLIVSKVHNITTNTTISGQTAIVALRGARFNISSGALLTINTPFIAGLYQVFQGNIDSVRFGKNTVSEVYPQWFGAKADSSTNDAAAIQAAIASLPVNSGGTVKLFPGNYDLGTTTLNMNKPNMRFEGSGNIGGAGAGSANRGATRLLYTGTGWAVDFGDGSTFSGQNIKVTNIIMDGELTGRGAMRFFGMAGSSSWGNTIDNVRIVRFTGNEVRVTQRAWSNTFRNMSIVPGAQDTAIYVAQEGNDLLFENVEIDDDGTNVPAYGFMLGNGSGVFQEAIVLDQVTVQGCSIAVVLRAPTQSVTIRDPYFEADSIDVLVNGAKMVNLIGGFYNSTAGKQAPIIITSVQDIIVEGMDFSSAADSANIYVNSTGTVSGRLGPFRNDANPRPSNIQIESTVTNELIIEEDGNLGIGSANPSAKLHVVNSGDLQALFGKSATTGDSDVLIGQASASNQAGYIRFDRTNSSLHMAVLGEGDETFVIDDGGNIGLGTVNPFQKLHMDRNGGTDSTGTWWANASATTTDATLTNIFTLATGTDKDYLIEVSYVASETDGTNEYYAKLFFAVSNVAGTVTEDSETDIFEDDNSAASAADASGAVSGTNYLIQWTGVAAETWNCEVSVKATVVAH